MSVLLNLCWLKPALAPQGRCFVAGRLHRWAVLGIGLPPYMSFRSAGALRNHFDKPDNLELLRESSLAALRLARNDIYASAARILSLSAGMSLIRTPRAS